MRGLTAIGTEGQYLANAKQTAVTAPIVKTIMRHRVPGIRNRRYTSALMIAKNNSHAAAAKKKKRFMPRLYQGGANLGQFDCVAGSGTDARSLTPSSRSALASDWISNVFS